MDHEAPFASRRVARLGRAAILVSRATLALALVFVLVGWVAIGRAGTLVDRSAGVVADAALSSEAVASVTAALIDDTNVTATTVDDSLGEISVLATTSGKVAGAAAELSAGEIPDTIEKTGKVADTIAGSADFVQALVTRLAGMPESKDASDPLGPQIQRVGGHLSTVPAKLRASAEALREGSVTLDSLSERLDLAKTQLNEVRHHLADAVETAHSVAETAGSISRTANAIQVDNRLDEALWRTVLVVGTVMFAALVLGIERVGQALVAAARPQTAG